MSSNAVSLGYGSKALWNDSTALGSKAKAMANYSTAVGYGALARSERSVSVGYEAKARSEKSVSVGYEAKAGLEEELDESRYNSLADTYKQYYKKDNGKYKLKNSNQNNIAIGYNSESLGASSLALGYGSVAAKDHAISLGTKSNTQGSYSISVGHEAKASNDNSIALGYQANAQKDNSVALGGKSVASIGSGVIGLDFATNNPSKETNSAWRSTAGAVSVGDETKKITRQITNVAAGTQDTDAVNVAQIKSLTNQGFHTQANYNATDITKGNDVSHKLGGIIKVGGGFKLTGSNKNLNDFLSSENLATSINKDGSINLLMAKTPKFDDINILKDGKNYTSLTTWIKSIENSSQANNIKYFSVNSGEEENKNNDGATGNHAIAIGPIAKAKGDNSVAIGLGARSQGLFSVATGSFSNAKGSHSTAIGYNSEASALNSIALGTLSAAKNTDSISIGNRAQAEKDGSIALGSFAKAKERGSLALGLGSQANAGNSVALGLYSIADVGAGEEGKYFGVGANAGKTTATWTSTAGAVSVGGKIDIQGQKIHLTRQITNVAAGTQDTDAVNVAQLKSLKDYSDKTFASKTELNNITNNLNSKVSDVKGKNNIKVESKGTEKIVSLEENIDLTNNGSIKFGDGKTEITKDKATSKDLVATNGTNTVTISGDNGTITGLTNTKWNGTTNDASRAATEGQLKELQENFTTNLNGTVNQTLGKYKLKGDEGKHNIYGNETLTIKGDKNIKTKATEDGNLDIKLSKNLDLKDGSITLNNAKLDEKGLSVNNDKVKITENGVTIKTNDPNKTVNLTKNGLNNGDNKITNVADGEADNDAATVGQLKNIAASASSVKESNDKEDWAKEKPKATGKNSVSIAGGSTDGGRNNTVSVGSKGNQRTISNVAPGVLNSDAATVGQLKAGLNNVHGKLDEYKKDSRAGTASAMAIGNLPQSTIPGKGMVSLGGGFYDGESAMAIGLSKMSDDGKWVVKGSASYDSQENAGATVSVGFHF